MTGKKITQLLEELREELAGTEAVDEKGRDLLQALDQDIHSLLERSEEGGSDDTLLERLQETIDHFEVSHPALTSAVSNLLTSLSNAGI
jgi:predicted outer membrane protein